MPETLETAVFSGGSIGAGEGIRTLDPDLGKVSAELFPVVTPD